MQPNCPWMLLQLLPLVAAGVLPREENVVLPADAERFGYLELKPNGTLILSSDAANQSVHNVENLLLLRSVLQALNLQPKHGQAKLNIKIYGDGVEHKFPPILENILQRIQSFFSIYRYTDTSRPVRQDELAKPTTETTTVVAVPQPDIENELIDKEPALNDDYIMVGEPDDEKLRKTKL